MSILSLCDCSTNGLSPCIPTRCRSCGGDCSGNNCPTSNINLKAIEKQIQNQVGVYESQYTDVLAAVTIAQDYLDLSANLPTGLARPASSIWGNRFNLRNQSDRREASRTGSSISTNTAGSTNYVNVPTRGNSTRSTITANKPGAMTPGGYGVDVKHGSYARYLGKIKGQAMALGTAANVSSMEVCKGPDTDPKPPACSSSINNKSYRFTLVNTRNCLCNGVPILSSSVN